MKKNILISVCMFSLFGCCRERENRFPPPNFTSSSVGGSAGSDSGDEGGSIDSGLSVTEYNNLCEDTDGTLVFAKCCDKDHPFYIDVCKGEEACVMGGDVCNKTGYLCECEVGYCFSLENGCQPI